MVREMPRYVWTDLEPQGASRPVTQKTLPDICCHLNAEGRMHQTLENVKQECPLWLQRSSNTGFTEKCRSAMQGKGNQRSTRKNSVS